MLKIIVCSSFYEKGRKYIKDFFEGFESAALNTSALVTLNLAIDDLKSPELTLKNYREKFNIETCRSEKKLSISDTRNLMIKNALKLKGDVLIFIDMDDILLKEGINTHLEALKNSMISYGDMKIINEKKTLLNYSLFEGKNIPSRVNNYKVLLNKNFFGLSNTALNKSAFKYFREVPSHLKATDWWLFTTLLYKGCKAKRTKLPIGMYRQHDSNVLGFKKKIDIRNLILRCQIAENHFNALPKNDDFEIALKKVTKIKNMAIYNPRYIMEKLNNNFEHPNLWFEEIFNIYQVVVK